MADIGANCSRELLRRKGAGRRPNALMDFHMNPIDALDFKADYAPADDAHWNTDGDHRIGKMLSDCALLFAESQDMLACGPVKMP
ncbi:MAG: hypothetical protein OXG23_14695 [Chloroflexi bacterium]|nr:hypothetical protein [Chloroflexota bacterium]